MFPLDSKILIVEDSSFSRQALRRALSELKYTKIIEAVDVASAQKLLLDKSNRTDPIQLVISDLYMPETNGLEFLQWIRKRDELRGLPVIMLTSSQDRSEVVEAGRLGAASFIIKPFQPNLLRDRIALTWTKFGKKYREHCLANMPPA